LSNLLTELKDQETINKFSDLEAALNATGLRYTRWSTARFAKEQYALWCQGRKTLDETNAARLSADMNVIVEWTGKDEKKHSDNDYSVTECDGYKKKSQHQSLVAVDYVVLTKQGNPTWDYVKYCVEYRALRDIATALGFNCGGSWMKLPNKKDSPYISVNLGWDPPHIQIG
jgi:hypothetical protein